ncbi:MAG: hypothetical protein J0I12_15300 [Candidatus Eremiobacteraeota bacterium]|nr:hypothetical protein [Candidatus Eremiobacteraeota bacterium]
MMGLRGTLLALGLCALAVAAPLFPGNDDAYRWLREMGLSDAGRASTRWEVALQLARAQERIQAGLAPLLSKAELQHLQALLAAYKDELEALGVRVDSLENRVANLDERVEELGRIRFSGQFRSSFVSMGVHNNGQERSGFGGSALNYGDLVGAVEAANLSPLNAFGTQPVLDYSNGRPLVNGSGFSNVLSLNVEADLSEDLLAELRVYAYSSQGNPLVDSVWGVQPPIPANPFGLANAPFTSMGLERLAVTHTPTATSLVIGSFAPRFMSPQIYMGTVNPRVGNPRILESYGLQISGELDNGRWGWEGFGTRLYDGNPGVTAPYRSYALGGAVNYHNAEWTGTLSFLRAFDDNGGQVPGLTTGQITNANQLAGLGTLNWVNPPGFFVNQLGGPLVAGTGLSTDARPLGGFPGSDLGGPRASFGPQAVTMGGLHLEYAPKGYLFQGDYSVSSYRPSRNSGYSTAGTLWRLGGAADWFEDKLHLEVDYRHTDARYDPMILQFGNPLQGSVSPLRVYHRFPDADQFWLYWSLHNTDSFPHNRQGLWLTTRVQYDPDGSVTLNYRNLSQVSTSLQDVRIRGGSLGTGLPGNDVLGFSPGFIDVVFREFSPLSFDASYNPLENPRGHVSSAGIKVSQVFTGTPWKVAGSYDSWTFRRSTALPAQLGGSQNRVDLTQALANLEVGYKFNEDFLFSLGVYRATSQGHYDPGGVYNAYAFANNNVDFRTRDLVQTMPYLKADWNVSSGVRFNSELMFYQTRDHVPASIQAGAYGGAGATSHPFNWDGYRLSTALEVDF